MSLKKTNIAPPRMDFRVQDYETIIYQKGRRVWYEKAVKCPCKSKNTSGPVTCKNCGGIGWLFMSGRETRMVVTGVSFTNENKQWTEEERGMISISCLSKEQLTFMDRITLLDAKSIHQEVIHFIEREGEYYAWTIYTPTQLLYAGAFLDELEPLRHLTTEDLEFGPKNLIKLKNLDLIDQISTDTLSVTLRYYFSTVYHVVELKRETMQSLKYEDGNEVVQDMPISALARRAHLELDPITLDGHTLLENLYPEAYPCDFEDIIRPEIISNTPIDIVVEDGDNNILLETQFPPNQDSILDLRLLSDATLVIGSGTSIYIGDDPPLSPLEGQLWLQTF
jgi:hypothetical protein